MEEQKLPLVGIVLPPSKKEDKVSLTAILQDVENKQEAIINEQDDDYAYYCGTCRRFHVPGTARYVDHFDDEQEYVERDYYCTRCDLLHSIIYEEHLEYFGQAPKYKVKPIQQTSLNYCCKACKCRHRKGDGLYNDHELFAVKDRYACSKCNVFHDLADSVFFDHLDNQIQELYCCELCKLNHHSGDENYFNHSQQAMKNGVGFKPAEYTAAQQPKLMCVECAGTKVSLHWKGETNIIMSERYSKLVSCRCAITRAYDKPKDFPIHFIQVFNESFKQSLLQGEKRSWRFLEFLFQEPTAHPAIYKVFSLPKTIATLPIPAGKGPKYPNLGKAGYLSTPYPYSPLFKDAVWLTIADSWKDLWRRVHGGEQSATQGVFGGFVVGLASALPGFLVFLYSLWSTNVYWIAFGWFYALFSSINFYRTLSEKPVKGITPSHIAKIFCLLFGIIFFVKALKMIKRLFKEKEKEQLQNQSLKTYKGVFILLKGITGLALKAAGIIAPAIKITHKQYQEVMSLFDDTVSIWTGMMLINEDGVDFSFRNEGKEDIPCVEVIPDEKVHEATFSSQSFEGLTFTEMLHDVWNHYKWIFMGIAAGLLVIILLVARMQKNDVQNEGKGKKFQRPQKRGDLAVDEENTRATRIQKALLEKDHFMQQKRQYDMQKADADEKQSQYAYAFSKAGHRFTQVDRPLTIKGELAPEKLLMYDHVILRLGRWETTPLNLKTHENAANLIMKSYKAGRDVRAPVLVGVKSKENDYNWFILKNEGTHQCDFEIDDLTGQVAEALLDRKVYELRALNLNAKITDEDWEMIKHSKHPMSTFTKIVTDFILAGKREAQNEGLLGGNTLNTTSLASELLTLHNTEYGTTFGACTILSQVCTVAHGVYDVQLLEAKQGDVVLGEDESNSEKLKLTDISKDGDWAIFEPPNIRRKSLSFSKDPNYNGPGFMLIPTKGGVLLTIGIVSMKGNMCWHYIPTSPGFSGYPIFNMKGEVIAIHKAGCGLMNVAVPILTIIARDKTKFPIEAKNQGVRRNYEINLSYLPWKMQPQQVEIPENLPDLGENCDVVGAIAYNFKDYGKIQITPLYTDNFKDSDLPDPFSAEWGIAIPTIETITQDFKKYTIPLKQKVQMDEFYSSLSHFDDYLNTVLKGRKLRLLKDDELWSQVNKQASTGMPVKLAVPTKGDFVEHYLDTFYRFETSLLRGEDPTVMFDELGKEELRDLERLTAGKVRSFNSGGVHLYGIERRVFGDLCDIFQTEPFFYTHTTLGWSPYYGNWHELVRYMRSVGTGVYSGIDFAKWDSRFLPLVFDGILTTLLNHYEAEAYMYVNKVFKWWYKHVVAEALCVLPITKKIALLVLIYRGMKTGCLVTFLFNCFGNIIRHLYCLYPWIKNMPYAQVVLWCVWMTCGDDFTFAQCFLAFDIDIYSARSDHMCWQMEDFFYSDPSVEPLKFEFAGCTTTWHGGLAKPVCKMDRFIFNLAIIKKGMNLPQYLQKLDNLIRIVAAADIPLANKVIGFRDKLVREWSQVPGVMEVAHGFCTLVEAIMMHQYIYEAGPLIIEEPYKKEDHENDSSSLLINHSGIRIRYHGNYCGPSWSAGKEQESVESDVKAVDQFDQACKEHDQAYAVGEDLYEADKKFASEVWQYDKFASSGVYIQSLLRRIGLMVRKNGNTKAVRKVARRLKKEVRQIRAKAWGPKGPMQTNGPRRLARRGVSKGSATVPALFGRNLRGQVQRSRRAKSGKSERVTGQDYVTSVTTDSDGAAVGDVITSFGLNSTGWPTSRLNNYFTMYEKWWINKIEIDYDPGAGTATNGKIIIGVDPDPSDTFTKTGTSAVQALMSSKYSKDIQVSRYGKVVFRPERKSDDMFTSFADSERFSSFGNVFVLAASTFPANTTYGDIIVRYDITFYQPLLEITEGESGKLMATAQNQSVNLPVTKIDSGSDIPQTLFNTILGEEGIITETAGSEADSPEYVIRFARAGVYNLSVGAHVATDGFSLNGDIFKATSALVSPDTDIFNIHFGSYIATDDHLTFLSSFEVITQHPNASVSWDLTGSSDYTPATWTDFSIVAYRSGGIGTAKYKLKKKLGNKRGKVEDLQHFRDAGMSMQNELAEIKRTLAQLTTNNNNVAVVKSGSGKSTPKT